MRLILGTFSICLCSLVAAGQSSRAAKTNGKAQKAQSAAPTATQPTSQRGAFKEVPGSYYPSAGSPAPSSDDPCTAIEVSVDTTRTELTPSEAAYVQRKRLAMVKDCESRRSRAPIQNQLMNFPNAAPGTAENSVDEFAQPSNGSSYPHTLPGVPASSPPLIDSASFNAAGAEGTNSVDEGVQNILDAKVGETTEQNVSSPPAAEMHAAPAPTGAPFIDQTDPRDWATRSDNEDRGNTDSDLLYEEVGKTLYEKTTGLPYDFEAAYQKGGQELGAKGLEFAGRKLGSQTLSEAGVSLGSEAAGAFLGITFAGSVAGEPYDYLDPRSRAWDDRQVQEAERQADDFFYQYPWAFCRAYPKDRRCNSPFQLLPYNLKLAPYTSPPVTNPQK